jgi:hypothetical protein
MKIPFEEILPFDVHLYVGLEIVRICRLWGRFDQMYLFTPLTLKMTVKIIHFQGQDIKSE